MAFHYEAASRAESRLSDFALALLEAIAVIWCGYIYL
jgi:hypothetical protein